MTLLLKHLDTLGNGKGTHDFVGNYLSTVTYAQIAPDPGEIWTIYHCLVTYRDAGNFVPEIYGAASSLVNGIEIQLVRDTTTIVDFTFGSPIMDNGNWGKVAETVDLFDWGAGGNQVLHAHIEFHTPVRLEGRKKDKFRFVLQDNFQFLLSQHFQVQGKIIL